MVDLPVSVLGLADATVGKGVAGMIGIHAEVEVVTGVSHGELEGRKRSNVTLSNHRAVFRNRGTGVLIYCSSFALFPDLLLVYNIYSHSNKQAQVVNSINVSTMG